MKKILVLLPLAVLLAAGCNNSQSGNTSQAPAQPAQQQSAPQPAAAPAAYNPYDRMPQVPSFTVTSTDVKDGQEIPLPQTGAMLGLGGKDMSPQLSWSGFPAGTKSFVVTMFDPDVKAPSGFWHWVVVGIPATVTSLNTGAGTASGAGLPAGAFQLRNDVGMAQYQGAAPPKGDGQHRYFIAVNALDTDSLGVDKNASPAYLNAVMTAHTIGRALIVPWYQD